jgi:hypothetical protein
MPKPILDGLRLCAPQPAGAQRGDIVRGLHLRPSSCQAVFCCHTLEHVTYQGCLKALHNMFECFQPIAFCEL